MNDRYRHPVLLFRLSSAGILLLLLLLPAAAGASRVAGLYETEVPVAGTEATQRNQAIREAMKRVLTKVTGSRKVARLNRVEPLLEQASNYVLQYSYRVETAEGGTPQRYLRVSFDPGAINRLLRQQGLPVWSENRPSILIWLGSEQKGRRRLLEPDPESSLVEGMRRVARERGLPILFPLMDLEDQARLQVADLWGDFEANIRTASERYGPDMILTGRLVQVDKRLWRGQWRLYRPQGVIRFGDQAQTREQLVADGMQQAADRLARLFAPVPGSGVGEQNTVRLRVGGVTGLEGYAAVKRLLDEQRGMERWSVVSVEPDALVIDLHGRSSVEALAQILTVGGVLEPDPTATMRLEEDGMVDLYFRMR